MDLDYKGGRVLFSEALSLSLFQIAEEDFTNCIREMCETFKPFVFYGYVEQSLETSLLEIQLRYTDMCTHSCNLTRLLYTFLCLINNAY